MAIASHLPGLSYQRLRDILPELVHPDYGVIAYVQELPRQNDMPDFVYFKAEIADTGIFGLQTNRPATGGTSLDRDRALAKAVGEAVERYCSAVFSHSELPLISYREIEGTAVHPSQFSLHTEAQMSDPAYPLTPFDESTPVRWTRGIHWTTQSEIWIPAAAVYCPYTADVDQGEAQVMEAISTGIAAHCSLEEAAINGILEVVERDNFMCHWLAMVSGPVVDARTLWPEHHAMLRRFRDFGYSVQVVYAHSDHGIPTVFCLMYGNRPGCVPLSISAATHLDTGSAITKALEELALLERLSQRVMITKPGRTIQQYAEINRLIDHLRFWMDPQMVRSADFLADRTRMVPLETLPTLTTGTPSGDLALIVQRLEETDHDVLICDVTTEDISALGMSVVRAVIPGFVPLNVRYTCRPEGSKRLQALLSGRKQHNNGELRINPLPHPFA